MRRKALKCFFSVCLTFVIGLCSFIVVHNFMLNSKNQNELLDIANNVVNSGCPQQNADAKNNEENGANGRDEIFSSEELQKNKNVIGKLVINQIGVEAPIVEGVDQDSLKYAVGHFPESEYWNGNVCLASHNRGNYAHYFEKLDRLSVGDKIEYQTELGTKVYTVDEINRISEEDLSVLDNTKENTITLITCIKSAPELRLCVKGIEK